MRNHKIHQRIRGSCLIFLGLVNAVSFSVVAQEADPKPETTNECEVGMRGRPCISSAECKTWDTQATFCVNGTCQIPCEDQETNRDPTMCALGETCIEGGSDIGPVSYCQPASFAMDINLLDNCMMHFLNKLVPDLTSQKKCAVAYNINQMLDQDGDGAFTIFDADLCIRAFLEQEPCDAHSMTCPNGQIFCEDDDWCGHGLFCNKKLKRCERECGFIASREIGKMEPIERQCNGNLQVCDYYRGRCEEIKNLSEYTCQVDGDCPSGAFCFLGACEKKCYRHIDCPDSNWYCSPNNTCQPKPGIGQDEDKPANPKDFSVQFAKKNIELDVNNDDFAIPLLIMNLASQKQEFDNPSLSFGFRLETKYGRKETPACNKPINEMSEEERIACEISDDEQFLTMKNPFGVVYAAGNPNIEITLNHSIFERLDPGRYSVTLRAIFSNGSGDTATITVKKTTPSGKYEGRIRVFIDQMASDGGQPKNILGESRLSGNFYISQTTNQWDALLDKHNVKVERTFVDVTSGFEVHGYLNGDDNVLFNQPRAGETDANGKVIENKVPLIGLYSPQLGRLRLMAVVDIPADLCHSENGECHEDDDRELQVKNMFGRPVRRLMEFIGPYDEKARTFRGIYRETFTGLMPKSVTLDGSFLLKQTMPDDSPIYIEKLVPDAMKNGVAFIDQDSEVVKSELLSKVEQEITEYCGEYPTERSYFASQEAFLNYLSNCDVEDPAYSQEGRILKNVVTFAGNIGKALDALDSSQGSAMTIRDFLRGQIKFCKESNEEGCIDEEKVRCGLALYKKSILADWWNEGELFCRVGSNEEGSQDEEESGTGVQSACHPLFCNGMSEIAGCRIPASKNPSLATFQEHNFFFRELWQALAFQAGNELSDAFFVLYRAQHGDKLGQSTAYAYKEEKLLKAWNYYNQAREMIFSDTSTDILFAWPMRHFQSMGSFWVQEMHAVMTDRMDTLEQLIDLKRRVFKSANEQQKAFIQHLVHEEYMGQVYLMLLQKVWQPGNFDYNGNGQRMIDLGNQIQARTAITRNPLGFQPNRIYFGNSNLQNTNWQNYRERIEDPEHGYLKTVRDSVNTAIQEMRNAMSSRHTFEDSVLVQRQQMEAALEQYCGSDEPLPTECTLPPHEMELETNCVGPECRYQFQCDSTMGDGCERVALAFESDTSMSCPNDDPDCSMSELEKTACRADTTIYTIDMGSGNTRLCVRGQLGQLLQEKVMLELQREQTVSDVQLLLRKIAQQQKFIRETQDAHSDLMDFLDQQDSELEGIQKGLIAAEWSYTVAQIATKAIDCEPPSFLGPGNCPIKLGAVAAEASEATSYYLSKGQLQVLEGHLGRMKEIRLQSDSNDAQIRSLRADLEDLITSVENNIAEYKLLTQQLFNLQIQMQDTWYLAQQEVRRYQESMDNLVNHLVGSDSGEVLRRNYFVKKSSREFLELLGETYKMAQAFIHRYNMNEQAEQIANRVYQIMTVDEVADFITELTRWENAYCEQEGGLDCDWVHNPNVVKISLQKLLFPSLRDIVDPDTGKVLTVGEQFHNLITSSTYITRRRRPSGMQAQIEIPFAIWLNDKGENGKPVHRYLISPDECNHLIVSPSTDKQGTIAVNVQGVRLREELYYELWRGDTDYIRSCHPVEQIVDGKVISSYPINTYTVGYAPSSEEGKKETPSVFFTHTQELRACKNDRTLEEGKYNNSDCFRFFARDRSLGAPDYKLVIPRIESVNEWILGKGPTGGELPEDAKPIITDIEIYVRTSGRPITNMQ